MTGVVLETLNVKKLLAFIVSMLAMQTGFFLIGGLIAPAPNTSQQVLMSKCVDYSKDPQRWLYVRHFGSNATPSNCAHLLPDGDIEEVIKPFEINADELVFIAQVPHPRDGRRLQMTRWFQQMLGVLMLDIKYKYNREVADDAEIKFDLRLGYRNHGDPEGVWHELAHSHEVRPLKCTLDPKARQHEEQAHSVDDGNYYECEVLPLFTLASCHHAEYLLNLRIPANDKIGVIQDVWMVEIHQNGGFTKVWFALKTFVFPITLVALIFFVNRVRELPRPPTIMEKTIIVLGVGLSILNCPVEWISLVINTPFWLVLSDIRQGMFFAILVCFWLVFTGEHMMDGEGRSANRVYWPRLLLVAGSSAALFIFELAERGVQIRNPFYSIWSHPTVARLGIVSVVIGAICAFAYMGYLAFLVIRALVQILNKRRLLANLPVEQKRYYSGVIYRFTALLTYTLICAALTVAFFIFNRVTEDHWAWGERSIEYGSAFITGVYGMWNVYVFAVLCLYAPSHKFRSDTGQELYDRLVTSVHLPQSMDSQAVGQEDTIELVPMHPSTTRSTVQNSSEGLAFLRKSAME
ncbi:Wntless Wnt ligand secretion mediator [Fasciola hepatica]|uniref:Wntless Wnt ligand secretion mediator n=1 Tax=Fasciola hepatica TaxID=6192 RepID=A0A4E0RXA3_FASHE|nr:Wntless Wnt ligand secretion mediator [Fasciola hepatica]